jgi:hypothetical protein
VDQAGTVGLYTSITASGSDIYVSYYEDLNYNLKLAHYDGLSWTKHVVDTNGVGQYSSVGLQGSTAWVSYYDVVNGDLKVASSSDAGAHWTWY